MLKPSVCNRQLQMTHELDLEYVTLNLATSSGQFTLRRLQLPKAPAQLSVTCDTRNCVSVNFSD